MSVHCDGHPDCRDHSDEDRCTQPPPCSTDFRCPHSQECLLEDWLCDGEKDCKDETDEKVGLIDHVLPVFSWQMDLKLQH